MADVLLVEDRDSLREVLVRTLAAQGWSVSEARDGDEARRLLAGERFLAVLTDLRLPRGSGLEVLAAAREADPETVVIVMTAFGSVEEAVSAMKAGAADFLTKPVDTDHLLVLLGRALDRRRLLTEYVLLKEEQQRRFGLPRLLGEDPAWRSALLQVQRAAATDSTVLLLGESGTGKELISRALHQLSPRAKGPFVAINCAAIPEALLENELFGHEKGAFTGASARKVGKVEMAHRGTLFLDEVGDMPHPLQAKVLRLLQERQFERVGGLQPIAVDVRVVAATHRDLKHAVAERAFREDLFYRLAVFPVEIPPLRQRRGDILPLAEAFLQRHAHELGRRGLRLSEAARARLQSHAWPGNVRELQNCLERAAILCDGTEVQPSHLRLPDDESGPASLAGVLDLSGPLDEVVRRAGEAAEAEAIRRALAEARNDRAAAAQRLAVSPRVLARRMAALGLE